MNIGQGAVHVDSCSSAREVASVVLWSSVYLLKILFSLPVAERSIIVVSFSYTPAVKSVLNGGLVGARYTSLAVE